MTDRKTLLFLGYGYSAAALAARLEGAGWRLMGTTRKPAKAAEMRRAGVEPLIVDSLGDPLILAALDQATHVISSVPPAESGDPVAAELGERLLAAPKLEWAGYLSTIGVYGDRQGGWVDEDSALEAADGPGARRIEAERAWRGLAARGLQVEIFRLAGIYGPGRSPLDRLKSGDARIVVKPGQVFNRIHVEDIALVLEAAMAKPCAGAVYNLCDDEPADSGEVLRFGADLLGLPHPPEVPLEEAGLTPMGLSFYSQCKRASNRRIKEELGIRLAYPSYREGLRALAGAAGA